MLTRQLEEDFEAKSAKRGLVPRLIIRDSIIRIPLQAPETDAEKLADEKNALPSALYFKVATVSNPMHPQLFYCVVHHLTLIELGSPITVSDALTTLVSGDSAHAKFRSSLLSISAILQDIVGMHSLLQQQRAKGDASANLKPTLAEIALSHLGRTALECFKAGYRFLYPTWDDKRRHLSQLIKITQQQQQQQQLSTGGGSSLAVHGSAVLLETVFQVLSAEKMASRLLFPESVDEQLSRFMRGAASKRNRSNKDAVGLRARVLDVDLEDGVIW